MVVARPEATLKRCTHCPTPTDGDQCTSCADSTAAFIESIGRADPAPPVRRGIDFGLIADVFVAMQTILPVTVDGPDGEVVVFPADQPLGSWDESLEVIQGMVRIEGIVPVSTWDSWFNLCVGLVAKREDLYDHFVIHEPDEYFDGRIDRMDRMFDFLVVPLASNGFTPESARAWYEGEREESDEHVA